MQKKKEKSQRPLSSELIILDTRRARRTERLPFGMNSGSLDFFFESAFVVNSTSPMVPCKRYFVAVPVAHTHTPRRTARPPTAPPRRERDEEMGPQQRRRHKHVWEGSVMRHGPRCPASLTFRDSPALSRQESDGRLPRTPCNLLPRRRPPIPPSSFPPRILRTPTSRLTLGLCPARPRPFCPSLTPRPDTHIQGQTRRPALKRKRKKATRRPAGETPRLCKPQRGAAIAEAVLKHNSKTRSGPGGLGGSLPDRRCTG